MRRHGDVIDLCAPAFTLTLDIADGLRATSWQNHSTGNLIDLGNGPELELDLDAAERRLWILGWRGVEAANGLREDYFRPEYDDSKWTANLSPAQFWHTGKHPYYWTRAHVFVPGDCAGKKLSLVLGGVGIYDFRYMRVFVNGRAIGTRRAAGRWHEPGVFSLSNVRIGHDNVIALQLAKPIRRTTQLDELDPQSIRSLTHNAYYPAQFEQYVVVGQPLHTSRFKVKGVMVRRAGCVEVQLRSQNPRIAARVRYEWNSVEPVLRKTVQITNAGKHEFRLMNLRLGVYQTTAKVSDGEQGFPVYVNDETFVSLAHPSGWATGQKGRIELRQYPGKRLAPGESFDSMEAIYGVAEKAGARGMFLKHIRCRMRRVRRAHDKTYAIYSAYGAWPIGADEFLGQENTEKILLDNLRKVARGRREADCSFDLYSVDFWVDQRGDLERPHPHNFPRGFARVFGEIRKQGMKPGLWIDSCNAGWSIGLNPVISPSRAGDATYTASPPWVLSYMCRASEPAKTMYETAFRHHLRQNGVRLLKFDMLRTICYNPAHDHLPGIYSTEAIQSSVIEFLEKLDAETPDVFIMLYWGHRSPWWLLYGDTIFEPGLAIEASSPGLSPTLYIRDGVTQGLDQAHWYCQDVPALGKDSLGVWLSDWRWNSGVGKERWQEAFVMDMCRGNLLAQPWSDHAWLSAVERKQLARFIDLLRARPECFGNSRFILGNPWNQEPYGYCCTDGRRAFLAIHNCCWSDREIELQLNATWGLPADGEWNLYRWHPNPAQLTGDPRRIALRPFEIVLIEVVPANESPSLDYHFRVAPIPQNFAERTQAIPVTVSNTNRRPMTLLREDESWPADVPSPGPKRVVAVKGIMPPSRQPGTLVITAERNQIGRPHQGYFPNREIDIEGRLAGRPVHAVAALESLSYPSAWQTWRMQVAAADQPRTFEMFITARAPADVTIACRSYYIPGS